LLGALYKPLNRVLSVSACSRDSGDDGGNAVHRAVSPHRAIIKLESVRVTMAFRDGGVRLDTDNQWRNENSLTSGNPL
jgi:hypothetical protein